MNTPRDLEYGVFYDLARRRMVDSLLRCEAKCYDSETSMEMKRALVERFWRIQQTELEDLPYDEFLESPYWLWLSQYMKRSVGWRCQGCRRQVTLQEGLDVHHKTYEHRGSEYPDYLSDLEVLCRNCHKRRHGRKPANGNRPGWAKRHIQ